MKLVENEPTLVKTNTDEFYFPSRLIYRIKNKAAVLKKLDKLSCFYKHPKEQRWLIECSGEALAFNDWNQYYIQASKRNDPIVIAFIKFPKKTTMHVYMRSFERVVPVLKILDEYLPQHIAIGTHHDMCFKLITAKNQYECPSPEAIFADESKINYPENMRKIDQLEEKARLTKQDYSKEISALFMQECKEVFAGSSIHDLERKRLEQFYSDGAENFTRTMKVQKSLAIAKHQAGGKLDPRKFFEQILKNDGQPIDSKKVEAILNASQ